MNLIKKIGFGIWKSLLDFMEVLEVTMVHDYSRIVNNKKILEISGYLGDYKQNSTAFNSRYNFSPGGISPNCKNEIMFNKNDLLANETTEKYRDLVIKEEYIDEPGRLISLSNIEYEGKNENAQEILTDNNTMKQICINEDKDKDILSPGVNSIFSTNLLKSVSHSYEKENEISYNESSRENGESGRDTKTNTASQNRQKSKTQRSMEFATKK